MEKVVELVGFVAPLLAGFMTSVLIPLIIKKVSLRSIETKIENISPIKEIKELRKEIAEVKREILQMRGKTK